MRILFLYTLLLLVMPSNGNASSISPFETDYCTNYPEGTKTEPELWKHCCLKHDLDFWVGGTKKERLAADLEFRSCIEKTGSPYQARMMYLAVRLGSYSPIKYPNRKWSNGWQDRPDFTPLDLQDILIIESELFSGYDFISREVKESFVYQLRRRLD